MNKTQWHSGEFPVYIELYYATSACFELVQVYPTHLRHVNSRCWYSWTATLKWIVTGCSLCWQELLSLAPLLLCRLLISSIRTHSNTAHLPLCVADSTGAFISSGRIFLQAHWLWKKTLWNPSGLLIIFTVWRDTTVVKLVGCHYCLIVHKILGFGSVGLWTFTVRLFAGKAHRGLSVFCVHVLFSKLPDIFPLCLMLWSLTKICYSVPFLINTGGGNDHMHLKIYFSYTLLNSHLKQEIFQSWLYLMYILGQMPWFCYSKF